jgi:pterin-4a-carbinolamine dehydratase
MSDKLSKEAIEENLKNLPGWKYENNSIKKLFITRNYPSTMGFVTAVGAISQKHNHHPDYVLMKYNAERYRCSGRYRKHSIISKE